MLHREKRGRILSWATATEILPFPPLNWLGLLPFPNWPQFSPISPPLTYKQQHGTEEIRWPTVPYASSWVISPGSHRLQNRATFALLFQNLY